MKKILLTALAVFFANQVAASVGFVTDALIVKTMIQDKTYGGCMVKLDKQINSFGLNCPSSWVTFSCDGFFSDQAVAQRKYDLALMALALDKPVTLRVDDGKKHNGYCYANRIDVAN